MQGKAGPALGALAAAALIAGAAAAAALPRVGPPDFARAEAVRGSLEAMHRGLEREARQTGHWLARRGAGHCANALQRLEWRVTSAAYDTAAGERIWRDCHEAYGRARLYQESRREGGG